MAKHASGCEAEEGRARRRRIINNSAAGRTYRPHEITDADFEGAEALVFGYFDELTVS
jgi:hypothetical protein